MTQREDRERIAMGLMAYKRELEFGDPKVNDLFEYNFIELMETDELAKRMNLDSDYYQPESLERLKKLKSVIRRGEDSI